MFNKNSLLNTNPTLHPYKRKRKSFNLPKTPYIVISFDDGVNTDYTEAYAYMSNKGMLGTSFLNTNVIDTGDRLTWTQIHEMYNNGWDFQCHGHTHTRLSDFTTEAEIRQQFESVDNAFIAQSLPVPKHHAYTYGVWTEQAKEIIWDYRETQLTTGHDMLSYNEHDTALPILTRFAGDTIATNTEKYDLVINFINFIKNYQKIGVLYFHNITENVSTTDGCYKPYFIDYINLIYDLGIEVVTVKELYDILLSEGFNTNYPMMEFTDVGGGIWEVEGQSTQVGTPSPDNTIPIISNYPKGVYKTNLGFYIRLYEDLRGIGEYRDKITVNKVTGEKMLTKNIGEKTMTGNDGLQEYFNDLDDRVVFRYALMLNHKGVEGLCTHYPTSISSGSTSSAEINKVYYRSSSQFTFKVERSLYPTVSTYNAYLANQLSIGLPVAINYVLANPTNQYL